jgi:seryl-tRNA synthetase
MNDGHLRVSLQKSDREMLQINSIREDRDGVAAKLAVKGFGDDHLLDELVAKDDERKQTQGELDELLARSNSLSKEVGELFKAGKQDEAEKLKEESASLKDKTRELQERMAQAESGIVDILVMIPNVPHESVPSGNTEADNEIIREGGTKPDLGNNKAPHWDLATKYDLIDMELGNKITGAGFPVYLGKGAKLQRALISFFLDKAVEAGYKEVIPPYLVNEETGFGTGQLPDKEGQMYGTKDDPFFLIPTAEVPVTNIYRGDIVKSEELPIKLTAHSPCFRREAGSYGKDVRGLNRVHQFDKVEVVQIARPERSYEILDEMVAYVEGLLNDLELPYRVARLCGGDLSFASALTFDMEVWSAAQERWLEVSSISNFEAFQANRMKMRYKDDEGKTQLVHTLNGSALALPRIVASILENNQTADGINIPEALRPYTGFDSIS